jgi:3-methyladenine DNA glycosylase/8-oxoguanine DNA glycosylase
VGEDAGVGSSPDAQVTYLPAHPLDLLRTLAPLRRGRADPTVTLDERGLWRAAATPHGPGTLLLTRRGLAVAAQAWGPGAAWLVAGVPELLGSADAPESFTPGHPLLHDAARRLPGMRTPRCRLVFEMTAAAVLEQKVTGREAKRSWRELVRRFGTPAPGPAPAGLTVAPAASVFRRIPSWEWHRAGVDGKRSRTVLAAAEHAPILERSLHVADPSAVLRQVPGIGVWTAAEVMQRAHGDADAVSYGDFHIPSTVGWALAGSPFDDDQLRQFLRPWAGHRGRVVRLVEQSGFRPPRFGPRYAGVDYRGM